ncbi:transporter [Gemmata sp. G18]|uniref:Transporter n=1 Tax=Gemmata palustris TaxID=2822762 RepID=A0ABS5BSI1_9BACT|nr:transporter [Gemmata palustris]MBP3956684.1 transporter [Gemmata palustris]
MGQEADTGEPTARGYLPLAQSLSVGYTVTSRLGAYPECYAIAPSGAAPAQVGPQFYYNGGLLYQVTPNFLLDARFGVGLNKQADDFFTGVGFAIRYGARHSGRTFHVFWGASLPHALIETIKQDLRRNVEMCRFLCVQVCCTGPCYNENK